MTIQRIPSLFCSETVWEPAHYQLSNSKMSLTVSEVGGAITSIITPDRDGMSTDISAGFADINDYRMCGFAPCSIVGRYANRIKNGRFSLNGHEIQLSQNDYPHHLHGGSHGFHQQIWKSQVLYDKEVPTGLLLSLSSPDGDEGFPGNLSAKVCYFLDDNNQLILTFEAQCDQDTICNLAAHMAFNLGGHSEKTCLGHHLQLSSDYFYEADHRGIPTGTVRPVQNTPMDFRASQELGKQMLMGGEQLTLQNGFDHNWDIRGSGLRECFRLYDPLSGRMIECTTDMPCVHIYLGNTLDAGINGKGGFPYEKHSLFFTETQFAPDSPNHPEWEQPVLKKNQRYRKTTIYRFSTI